jgi:signal transduction histidine kinase
LSPRVPSKSHVVQQKASEASELSRHLLKAEEEERRRISRELHDETGQALMVLRFHLEMLGGDAKTEDQKTKIREALEVLDHTIEGLRRTIARLSPRVLEELGLVAAIQRQAQFLAKRSGLTPRLSLSTDLAGLDHDLEVALYRSVQEALNNIAKHSQAGNFTVRLSRSGNKVSLHIEDDGVGFSPHQKPERGFGLTGMRERAAALGGSMKIRSQPGKGTQIRIVLPVTPIAVAAPARPMHRSSAA